MMQGATFGRFEWVSLSIRMVWSCIDLIFPPPSTKLFKPSLMQATDSFPIDSLKMLHCTIARVEGTYTPETIQTFLLTLLHLLPSVI